MTLIEDTIIRLIKAGDKLCLVNCRAHGYMTIPDGEGSRGRLAFSVIIDPEPHMIHISLNPTDDYDVCLTKLAQNGEIVTKESGTCQGDELAEVITSMCNRVEHTEVITREDTMTDVATAIMEDIHAADPWCLEHCGASHFAALFSYGKYHGGVSFRVKGRPGQTHTITIQLTSKCEYEVALTQYLGMVQLNVTQRLETVYCLSKELAEVITSLCK